MRTTVAMSGFSVFVLLFLSAFIVKAQKDTLKNISLEQVEVEGGFDNLSERDHVKEVSGTSIYAGKKTEIITFKNLTANLAVNNSREIFAKIPGINIWESDEAGVQLGIAVRGLNPGRTSELNTRQNGYDISADALGYPESYYVPTSQALEKIEIVRGAASLQYGTQFGGLLNFIMKKPPKDKPFEFTSQQSMGSYGVWNSFNTIGGIKGKLSYYGFFHHKQGDGWRQNSPYDVNTGYFYLAYAFNERFKISIEYTKMHYVMQQPGGLTDLQFSQDPRQSDRTRNWFEADWNILAVIADYAINEKTKINIRTFGFVGSRGSIGNLDPVYKSDFGGERNLMYDNYLNVGMEARFLRHYKINKIDNTLLLGMRLYRGNTLRKQGNGTDGSDANYTFLHPDSLENSNFSFPNYNGAVFLENVVRIGEKLRIIPGARVEYIRTESNGYYNNGTALVDDNKLNARSFPLFGLGMSYYNTNSTEIYANISQAYRAINFNDLRVYNPSQRVDPNLKDASGYNIDIGYRGNYKKFFNFDIGVYFMAYNKRIGTISKVDTTTFVFYQLRTNIGDSRSFGTEIFGEVDMWKAANPKTENSFSIFSSIAYVNAYYTGNVIDKSIQGNRVELAPQWIIRTGTTFKYKLYSTSLKLSYTSDQYSDAQNTVFSANPINGIVPAYTVLDWSNEIRYKKASFGFGIYNLLNEIYFTRRATSYPGPGILPSSPRTFFITLGIKI